jgi:CRISPR system Cascade subunit CasE
MHLSRLVLNPYAPQKRRDLADLYLLHRTLARAFPAAVAGGPGRVLFRVDPEPASGAAAVLVQSEKEPDWGALPEGYAASVESKPFAPAFVAGQRLAFRLRASPSKKVGTTSKADRQAGKPKNNGRRVGLLTEDEQRAWLARKAEAGGFQVLDVAVTRERPAGGNFLRVGKPDHELTLVVVRFDGLRAVVGPDRFLQTLREGVGAAKGFGFGLLSLALPGR